MATVLESRPRSLSLPADSALLRKFDERRSHMPGVEALDACGDEVFARLTTGSMGARGGDQPMDPRLHVEENAVWRHCQRDAASRLMETTAAGGSLGDAP